MTFIKQYFTSFWNIFFLVLAITTGILELYALWYLLGWEPYIIIAILVCTFKSFILLNNKGVLGILLATVLIIITMFFSIQRPLSSILNYQSTQAQTQYYQSLVDRTNVEYQASLQNYQSLKKTYDAAVKDKAWGILRDFDKNNKLSNALQESNNIKNTLQKNEDQLLLYTQHNNNWYLSFIRLLIIIAVESMLVIASQKVKLNLANNNQEADEEIVEVITKKVKPKAKRKYTKRQKVNYLDGI